MSPTPFNEDEIRAEFEAGTRASHCERHPYYPVRYRIIDIQMRWEGFLAHARLSHDKIAVAIDRAEQRISHHQGQIADAVRRAVAEAVKAEREAIALDMKTRAEAERISRDMARRAKNDEIAMRHSDRALAFEHAAAAIRARKDGT